MNPHAFLKDEKMIEAVESIRRVDKDGYLYHMDCAYDYYDLPEQFKAVIDAGCSTFVTRSKEGHVLFCRNYDYSHYKNNDRVHNPRTGLNMIVEADSPKARYRSIGVADMCWLDFKNGSCCRGMADDGISDLSSFVLCPYICMDGLNEKGLALSILALGVRLDWQEIPFDEYKEKLDPNKKTLELKESGMVPDPYWINGSHGCLAINEADHKAWIARQELIETKKAGKPVYLHPIVMRMVLDSCANVEEAIAMFDSVNVKGAMPGADYHIMAADPTGKAVLLEWLGDDLAVTPIDHATNHYVAKPDPFFPHGCGRDELLKAGLFRTEKAGMGEDFLEALLATVIQDPRNGIDNSKTQYTCIYDLTARKLKIYSFGDLSRSWDYQL